MRPRKNVLLYCENELTASLLKVRLDVWGYAVDERSRATLNKRSSCDVALVVSAIGKPTPLLRKACAVVELASSRALSESMATHVVYGYDNMESLRETLKVAATRKRGPRKVA